MRVLLSGSKLIAFIRDKYTSWDVYRQFVVELANPINPCPLGAHTRDRVHRTAIHVKTVDLSHRYIHLRRSPIYTPQLQSSTRQHRKRQQTGRCCYVGIKRSGRYLHRSPQNHRETLDHEGLWKPKRSSNDISSKTTQSQETRAF